MDAGVGRMSASSADVGTIRCNRRNTTRNISNLMIALAGYAGCAPFLLLVGRQVGLEFILRVEQVLSDILFLETSTASSLTVLGITSEAFIITEVTVLQIGRAHV